MRVMLNFFKAMLRMPKPWVAWVGVLMLFNLVLPIYFFETLEARVILAAFLAGAGLMMALFAMKGFVRLLGLGHIFWIPLVVWLAGRVELGLLDTVYEKWILGALVFNSISLVIDAIDVIRYFKGEKEPTVTLPS